MSRRIDQSVWEERREWIERQARSGFSAARFCRENGLKLSNFQAWKRKFAGTGPAIQRKRLDPADKAQALLSNAFVQVPVPGGPRVACSAPWIEVVSASGLVVRVPAGNLPALQVVLGALEPVRETTHA